MAGRAIICHYTGIVASRYGGTLWLHGHGHYKEVRLYWQVVSEQLHRRPGAWQANLTLYDLHVALKIHVAHDTRMRS